MKDLPLSPEEWDFRKIPDDLLETAVDYEYLREDRGFVEVVESWHRRLVSPESWQSTDANEECRPGPRRITVRRAIREHRRSFQRDNALSKKWPSDRFELRLLLLEWPEFPEPFTTVWESKKGLRRSPADGRKFRGELAYVPTEFVTYSLATLRTHRAIQLPPALVRLDYCEGDIVEGFKECLREARKLLPDDPSPPESCGRRHNRRYLKQLAALRLDRAGVHPKRAASFLRGLDDYRKDQDSILPIYRCSRKRTQGMHDETDSTVWRREVRAAKARVAEFSADSCPHDFSFPRPATDFAYRSVTL